VCVRTQPTHIDASVILMAQECLCVCVRVCVRTQPTHIDASVILMAQECVCVRVCVCECVCVCVHSPPTLMRVSF